jgi:hypothetical protein
VPAGRPQLEALDRGLVAVSTPRAVFLSWRLLASEATGATDTGVAGPDFAVYRDGTKIRTVSDSTELRGCRGHRDRAVHGGPVVNGIELDGIRRGVRVGAGLHDLPLQKPADGVTRRGMNQAYTYSANDVSSATSTATGSTSTS